MNSKDGQLESSRQREGSQMAKARPLQHQGMPPEVSCSQFTNALKGIYTKQSSQRWCIYLKGKEAKHWT